MPNETIEGNYVCINARACTNGSCYFRGQYNKGFEGSFNCSFGRKEVYCIEKKIINKHWHESQLTFSKTTIIPCCDSWYLLSGLYEKRRFSNGI